MRLHDEFRPWRRMHTASEKRANDDPEFRNMNMIRASRLPNRLPSEFDDVPRRRFMSKSWKERRRAQHLSSDRFKYSFEVRFRLLHKIVSPFYLHLQLPHKIYLRYPHVRFRERFVKPKAGNRIYTFRVNWSSDRDVDIEKDLEGMLRKYLDDVEILDWKYCGGAKKLCVAQN